MKDECFIKCPSCGEALKLKIRIRSFVSGIDIEVIPITQIEEESLGSLVLEKEK